MAVTEPDAPLPSDDELITRLETHVYHVRLAAKSGESTDLHQPDMRPIVLLRLLRLAIVMICAMADKKKMGYQELKALFAEMRIAGRKAR